MPATSWATIDGATSDSFTTAALAVADDGTLFRAVFTNAAGSATSNSASLTVTTSAVGGLALLAGDIGGPGTIDGTGIAARFGKVDGLVVDPAGNVFVADTANHAIRKITPAGVVTTVAGLAGVRGSADGTGSAARFSDPMSITIDAAGNLFVADFSNSLIRKVTQAGVVATFAGTTGPSAARRSTVRARRRDSKGHSASRSMPRATSTSPTNSTRASARSRRPAWSRPSPARPGCRVTTTAPAPVRTSMRRTVSPSTPPATSTSARAAASCARSAPAGVVVTLAGSTAAPGSADGTGAAVSFSNARGVAVDAAGNVYVADANNCEIRKITPAGVVTTLAGALGAFATIDGTGHGRDLQSPLRDCRRRGRQPLRGRGKRLRRAQGHRGGRRLDGGGRALAPRLTPTWRDRRGFEFDFGGTFGGQASTAVDASGNVLLTDLVNGELRKITPAGVVTTVDPEISGPQGLAIDASGNVYIGTGQTIVKMTPANAVSAFTGNGNQGNDDGPPATATFGDTSALAIDASGNLYVADSINDTIRKVTPAGVVSTLAGSPGVAGSADGNGAAATFSSPYGVTVDGAGNLYVADAQNNTIRKITPGCAWSRRWQARRV